MPRTDCKLRILISGAPVVCCDAIASYLSTNSSFLVVGQTNNPGATAEAVCRHEPDIAVVIALESSNDWLSTLSELAKSGKQTRIILLTYPLDNDAILQAIEMGVRGFLPTESRMDVLNKCIRCVVAGEYWMGRDRTADLLDSLRNGGNGRAEPAVDDLGLTARQKQIIRAVLSGCSNKEIAAEFAISGETVKHHLTSIFEKLGLANRLELALFAMEHPLFTPNKLAKSAGAR